MRIKNENTYLLSVSCNSFAGLNTGLVAYWNFDDCTAKDNSGNGNDGIINGNPKCEASIRGKAFNFNGINDYIHVQNSPSLNITQTISYGGWVNLTGFTNSDSDPIIINKENIPFELAIHNFNNVSFCLLDRIPQYNFSFYIDIQKKLSICWEDGIGKKVNKNTWTHLFVTYDGTQVKTYYNEVLVKTIAITGAITNTSEALRIAARGGNGQPSSFFNGLIDEVRIYNRALTDSEIAVLYHQGVKPTKNGVSSNTDQCTNNANWCVHPTFTVFGVTKESDIPINLINTSYIVDGFNRNVSGGKVNITANLYNRGICRCYA